MSPNFRRQDNRQIRKFSNAALSIFLTALTSPCTYRSGRRTSFTPADANRDPITPRGGKNISDDTHVFIE